jgi:hypothetical protein
VERVKRKEVDTYQLRSAEVPQTCGSLV